MKLFKIVSLAFIVAMTLGTNSHTIRAADLVPNERITERVVTGILYKIQSLRDSMSSERRVLSSHDANNYKVEKFPYSGCDSQKWIIHSSEVSGFYKIQSLKDSMSSERRVLSSHDANNYKVEKFPYSGCDSQKWIIHSSEVSGFYKIQSLKDSMSSERRVLSSHDANNYKVEKFPYSGCDSQKFSFSPVNYRLSAEIENFQYDPMVEDLNALAITTVVSAVDWEFQNDSYDTPIIIHPAINQSKMNENSWAFTESHERNFFNRLEVGVSAKWCGVKGSVNNTTTWTQNDKTLEETKKHTIDQTEVSILTDIPLAPRKKVVFSIAWREVDATIPFTATVKVKGFSDCMETNGSIASMAQVDADGVVALLRHDGYRGEIIGRDGRFILARIHGNLKVNGAISGNLIMSSQDL